MRTLVILTFLVVSSGFGQKLRVSDHQRFLITENGNVFKTDNVTRSARVQMVPPSSGKGHDWVLVLDDPSRSFAAPGRSN